MPGSNDAFENPYHRPRERLLREGAAPLSLIELLALSLRTGRAGASATRLADDLVQEFGSLDALARAGNAELARVPGMGPVKIASLRAAFELGSRLAQQPLVPGEKLQSPEQIFSCFGTRLRHCRQEVFMTVLLDSRHRVIGEVEVSRGSLNQSLVHPREVFAPALRETAAAILVLHNHPSGDPAPSREDHEVTRRLARAGEILGIRLVDHVVVAAESYVSFARSGWLDPA
ncbi:MAG: JAB domain-containing protein [bacterium]|nr:JAB domain-containing protein [bacterium]